MGNSQSFDIRKCSKDILQCIFERLSPIDQYKYRLVCKKWKQILDTIISNNKYITQVDKSWGCYNIIDCDDSIFPKWELKWIPNDNSKYNFKKEQYKLLHRKKFNKSRKLYTKWFLRNRIKLFNEITDLMVDESHLFCKYMKLKYIDIYCHDDVFAVRIIFSLFNRYEDFYIRKCKGVWDGTSDIWNGDPKHIIDEYCRSGDDKVRGIIIEEDDVGMSVSHVLEYIIYITQNYIDNIND